MDILMNLAVLCSSTRYVFHLKKQVGWVLIIWVGAGNFILIGDILSVKSGSFFQRTSICDFTDLVVSTQTGRGVYFREGKQRKAQF